MKIITGLIILLSGLASAKASQDLTTPSSNLCGNAFRPELAIQKANCSAGSKVIIFGESHFIDKPIYEFVNEAGQNGWFYAFLEGQNYQKILSGKSRVVGLEDRLIQSLTSMQMNRNMLYIPSDTKLPDGRNVVYSSRQNSFDTILAYPDIWKEVGPKVKSINAKQNITEAFEFIAKAPEDGSLFFAWVNRLAADDSISNSTLSLIDDLWAKYIEDLVDESKNYSFAHGADKTAFIGDGRNILFAKAIVENYCNASKEKKALWVEIGSAHVEGTQCLLQHFLPAGTKIEKRKRDFFDVWKEPNYPQVIAERIKAKYEEMAFPSSDLKLVRMMGIGRPSLYVKVEQKGKTNLFRVLKSLDLEGYPSFLGYDVVPNLNLEP